MKRPDGYPPVMPRVANRYDWIITEAARMRQAARQRAIEARQVSAVIRRDDRAA